VNFPDADPAPFLYFTYREQRADLSKALGYPIGIPLASPDSPKPEQAQCLNITAEVLPIPRSAAGARTLVFGEGGRRARKPANRGSDARLVAGAIIPALRATAVDPSEALRADG
jgi:hypothetical protein